MRRNYEIANFDTRMPLRCMMQRIGVIEEHMHDHFEVDLILSGQCNVVVDGQTFQLGPEDVITIDGHNSHEFRGNDCVLISVQFEQALFEQTLPDPLHPRFFCNSAVQGDSAAFQTIRRLIAHLIKNNADQQQGYALRNWSYIYEFMDVMYNNFRVDRSRAQDVQSHRYAARVSKIARIVREHHTENFTLSRLAEMVHLSAPYLSKFFDQQFGMSFLAYLTQIRLNHAVADLLNTEKTIEDVSADSGFPNSHAFVQAFKKEYGILPSVYRRQNRQKENVKPILPTVEHHDYMGGLKKYLMPSSPMATIQRNSISCHIQLSADANKQTLKHTWQNVMTVGSASDLLTADIQKMVMRMRREIGFQYIKFNGILCDELHVYNQTPEGKPVYNFTYIDKVFDFLQQADLRPIIQLSFMPALLAKNPDRRLFNYLVSEPVSLNAWAKLVSAVVHHLLQRYGAEKLKQWHFCVWTQPDSPSDLYGFSSDESFYEFYRQTYQAVKEIDPQLSFGTPPTYYIVREQFTNWYIPFLQWCRKNSCMPDFLNFYYYDTAILEQNRSDGNTFGFVYSMSLRETPDGFQDFVNQVNAERAQLGLSHLPIFLTEWNNTPSQQDLLNDTCFKSCYIVKNILENYDKLNGFGYWSLTDWMGEAPLPQELFFGGLGLFTVTGIPKASYYALCLLRQLGNTLIGQGDGWFATRQGEKISLLLYNYRHFSHLYAQGERFDMTFTDRYTPFDPVQNMDVHLTLKDVTNGTYLVRETILNRKSGSAFDKWVEMGAMELDTLQELKTLEALSTPLCSKYTVAAKKKTLEIDAILDMLEVRLITIEPANA